MAIRPVHALRRRSSPPRGVPMRESMFDVQAALRELVSRHGSDLHLKVDAPPLYRVDGILTHDERGGALSAEDTEHALHDLLHDPVEAAGIHRGARGRLLLRNRRAGALPHQRLPPARRDLAGVPRDPPQDLHDRGADAAAGRAGTGRGGARDRAAHGHHGLGQVDDAGGDDRPHERDDDQAHRHDRGPDRVRAPATSAR